MKSDTRFNTDHHMFSSRRLGEIVSIRLADNMLFKATEIEAKNALFDHLDRISDHDGLKVVILQSYPMKRGREEYLEFYRQLSNGRISRDVALRLFNAVNQLIRKIVDSPKLFIHVDSGKVIMMFFYISLACDYRIVADNTVFQNPCQELGLVPKGGGGYFLSKILGPGRTFDWFLSCRDMPAREALDLNLVDRVVPVETLEEAALATAEGFCTHRGRVLSGIKRLLGFTRRDLPEYLELENAELTRIIDSSDFKRSKASA